MLIIVIAISMLVTINIGNKKLQAHSRSHANIHNRSHSKNEHTTCHYLMGKMTAIITNMMYK